MFFENITYDNIIKYIIKNKDIFIGLITVIITIYIPVGVLFLTKISKDNVYKTLDEKIILEKIFNIKKIVSYIVMYFISLFIGTLIKETNCNFLIIPLILILIGTTVLLIIELLGIYNRYTNKGKDKIRLGNLSLTTDLNIRIDIFSHKLENSHDGLLIMKSFFNTIYKTDNRTIKSQLLEIYNNRANDNKYDEIFNSYTNSTFVELLNLNYITWSLEQYKEDTENYGRESNTINKITKKHLSNVKPNGYFNIIRNFKEHIDKYSEIELYKDEILEDFLIGVLDCENLLTNGHFIEELTKGIPIYEIKLNNYNNADKNRFFTTLINRIIRKIQTTGNDKYDISVDNVIENFFPGSDIICLSTLLHFYFIPFDPNDRVRDYSKHKINFGHISRIHIAGGEQGKKTLETIRNTEEEYTIEFILGILNIKDSEIKKYIKECENILKEEGLPDIENSRVTRLEYYLKKCLGRIETKKN